jgi:hypothetical protein
LSFKGNLPLLSTHCPPRANCRAFHGLLTNCVRSGFAFLGPRSMATAKRRMRGVNSRSPTSVVSFHVPLRMGSCVSCRVHRTRNPALISRLSSTRLPIYTRACGPTLSAHSATCCNLSQNRRYILPPSGNPSSRILTVPVPPPRITRRRSQPYTDDVVYPLPRTLRTDTLQPLPSPPSINPL